MSSSNTKNLNNDSSNNDSKATIVIPPFLSEAQNLDEATLMNKFKQIFINDRERRHNPKDSVNKFSTSDALEPSVAKYNRYSDVLPFNYNRVKLMRKRTGRTDDYINASYIKAPYDVKKYIVTQGPTKNTVEDFWLMVWEQNSRVIVMLTKEQEKNTIKCEKYWPELKSPAIYKNSGLKVELEKEHVTQLHFVGWPDYGVPESPENILNLIQKTNDLQKEHINGEAHLLVNNNINVDNDDVIGPIVIHCSAGCGRTDLFRKELLRTLSNLSMPGKIYKNIFLDKHHAFSKDLMVAFVLENTSKKNLNLQLNRMDEFFSQLTNFSSQLEDACQDLKMSLKSPALPISSGRQENYLRQMLSHTKKMINEIKEIENTPDLSTPLSEIVCAAIAVYVTIQDRIFELEEKLYEFGLEGSFIPTQSITSYENLKTIELIASKNTGHIENELTKENNILVTPRKANKTFKRLSVVTQESPTLENVRLSLTPFQRDKIPQIHQISDDINQLNSDYYNKSTQVLSSNERKRHINDNDKSFEQIVYRQDVLGFPRQEFDEITYDELLNEIGVGNTTTIDVVLLALITLNRIESRASDPDPTKRKYKVL
ncbi:2217_t:CDS:10 [Entrophospora sp. SA101]|nr:2217_t:CDS:10 [Entrophospora sp. SA101]CAJ0872545.1 7339_t:CDS:10 [Entrophospora sp. SA101]